jgi:adenosylcobinamide-GDP ribazoletransferase
MSEPAGGKWRPGHGGDGTAVGSSVARSAVAAVTLLTILPVPAKAQRGIGAREVARSAPFFPLVGALLGLTIGGIADLVASRSNSLLSAAVATVLLAVATGALHLDGLADSADALGARGGSRERRLEIMRDSSTGAYGTAAVAGWFVLMTATMASIGPDYLAVTLALSLAWSRIAAAGHAFHVEPARIDGLGKGFEPTRGGVGAATLIGVVLSVLAVVLPADLGFVSTPPLWAVIALVVVALGTFGVINAAARRLIGGRTGDTLGATITLVETAALLAAVLAVGH